MEQFLVSFNAIFPLTVAMALGYFLRRIKLLNEAGLKTLNALSFKVFLPIYLFQNIYGTDLSAAFRWDLLLFAYAAVGLYTALLIFAGYWLSAGKVVWIVFVAAVPVGAVVYLVLNTVWGRRRDNVFVISVLIWSLLATVYLGTLEKNMWILFFLGIPAQIVTILAFHIKLPTWKRTGKK